MLMNHMDVVPVDRAVWTIDPLAVPMLAPHGADSVNLRTRGVVSAMQAHATMKFSEFERYYG
jgi:hypothetical protein